MKIWLMGLFKHLFFAIDSALFNLIPTVYNLLISISRTSILSQAQIHQFADKIQMLLGIFMLFKVSFSLIMYVVNPDDFSDQSKGIGKLVQNTVISLILLVTVSYVFNMAYRLQVMILEDNTLARLILPGSENSSVSYINTAGDEMAFSILMPFFTPNTSLQLKDDTDADITNCVSLFVLSGNDTKVNDDCKKALNVAFSGDDNAKEVDVADDSDDKWDTDALNYIKGIENRSLGLTFRVEAATKTCDHNCEDDSKDFVIDYPWPFTTVVAVVVLLLLINFCMDIGLRSVKLAFLQLIAPIPIISYMDPKGGKDGLFGKWYKMCFSTYISLFVRLLALYFGIYIISQVGTLTDVINGSVVDNLFVKVFIIIGVLMFIKQLPKILDNLGIKLDGEGKFNLNPFKKIGNEAAGMQKPMDKVNGLAKGIGLAPAHALQTGGRRLVAGAYSAYNGRGFMRGAKSVDSNFRRKLNDRIDKWAPDFAKDRKDARVAQLDMEEQQRKDKMMEPLFNMESSKRKVEFSKRLQGLDGEYYNRYQDVDAKKKVMYDEQEKEKNWRNAIYNGTVTPTQRAKLTESLGLSKTATDDEITGKLAAISGSAAKQYEKANANLEKYANSSASARRAHEFATTYDDYDKMHPDGSQRIIRLEKEELRPEPGTAPASQLETDSNGVPTGNIKTDSGLIITGRSADEMTRNRK